MVRRIWLAGLIAAALMLALMTCDHGEDETQSFVRSLHCGMTRAEVIRLARDHHYNPSDPAWLTRSAAASPAKSKQLSLLDFTFRDDRLVGLREGDYDPRTKRIEYRDIDLCGQRRSSPGSPGK
jgi:hypothetical protein